MFLSIQVQSITMNEKMSHDSDCLVVHITFFLLPKDEEKEEAKYKTIQSKVSLLNFKQTTKK